MYNPSFRRGVDMGDIDAASRGYKLTHLTQNKYLNIQMIQDINELYALTDPYIKHQYISQQDKAYCDVHNILNRLFKHNPIAHIDIYNYEV